MSAARITNPPRARIHRGVKLDHIALVPASLLPFRAQWQAFANALPHGDILIVLPYQEKQQRVARSVASQLREKGKDVRVMDQELQQDAR